MIDKDKFSWIPFYTDFADKLLTFKNNRKDLISLIEKVYLDIPMKLPKLDNGDIIDIDPFTVYGLFNKGITDNNRIKIINAFKKELGINKETPTEFNGIPVLNNMHATFYYFAGDRKEKDIDNLWELFECAINYSKPNSDISREQFIELFNRVRNQQGVAWNITMGLFWMRPYDYINLDSCSRAAFNECRMIPPVDYTIQPMIKNVVSGEDYFKIIDLCKECFVIHNDLNFPELSYRAWTNKSSSNEWWPSLDEYNPNLSKEDWIKYILEIEKPEHPCPMQMLRAMMELGGIASCKQLSQKFGGTTSYYVGCTMNLGRRVKKFFDLSSCMDGEQERYFPFPFLGKALDNEEGHQYLYKIRPELVAALNEIDLSDISPYYDKGAENMKTNINKNTILYGPPGTGKTYITARYAVAIIENKPLEALEDIPYEVIIRKYNEYKAQGRIEFTTFHQSYGYEEFIEGIKPVLSNSDDIQYKVESGLFKMFCEKVGGNRSFNEAWDSLIESARENDNRYIFTRRTGTKISAELRDEESFIVKWNGATQTQNVLGKAKINKQWENDDYTVRDSLSGGSRWLFDANQAVIDEMISRFELKCKSKNNESLSSNYVFIIDEINRGNISKIFGELITLIEPTKRLGQEEAVKVKLPYSQKLFGVPDNVYIIGTMNTADRSIAAIDTALRRRFAFEEMMPDSTVLEGLHVGGVSIPNLLDLINERIEVLYDREHTIGHAYFTPLLKNNNREVLFDIFRNKIFPLLQEYFYEDYEKIRLVLGDNQKSDEALQFINEETVDYGKLFGSNIYDYDDKKVYAINEKAFENIEAYKEILKGRQ